MWVLGLERDNAAYLKGGQEFCFDMAASGHSVGWQVFCPTLFRPFRMGFYPNFTRVSYLVDL